MGSISPTVMAMSPLELAYGTVSHTLPIPARLYKSACALRDQYIFSFDQPIDEEGGVIEDVKVPETTKDLVLGFLLFLANNHDDLDLSLSILVAFERVLLGDRDIHSVVARTKRKPAAKAEILRIFFQLKEMAEYPDRQQESNHQGHRIPALLRAAQQAKARVVPIFGGQGNTENPIDELRSVYTIYRPLVESLFVSINKLLVNLSQDVRTGETYLETGFDMLSWLENPHLQPKKEDELSAALSFPLIGLLGLAYYTIFCKVSQITPGEAREYFQGTTGHSQGIIVAAAIAMATSWESFEKVSEEAVTLLFWIGFRSQEAWYPAAPLPALVQESLDLGEGQVSPMLRVRGLKRFEINAHLDVVNSHLPADEAIHVSLVNGKTNIVLTGPPNSLCLLCRQLRKVKKHKSLNLRFVSVNVPFHSSYLLDARERILDDVRELNFRKRDLGIAVYDTRSGYDLRSGTSQTLTEELVAMVTTACVDWPRATQLQGTTHVIDFGPGEINGIGAIIRENYAGSGIRVILASVLLGSETDVGFQPELFSPRTEEIKYEEDWATKYAPTLTSTPSGLLVENKFTRFFGMAPFMVAGMTPTTAHWDFVASCMNAGYHVELAGGGYHNAAAMETAIKKITRHVAPGLGITCNLIYASPQAMQWQLPLIRRLNHEGENIFGLTIGAGVPSLDVASDYIRSYGLRHISFKPASAEAMQQVIVIAKAHPQFPVILQWTGGRGGGHHSSEDFHEPLIEMYGRVRRCQNIIFVVGSGFGSGEDTLPYLTGTWSAQYGLPSMPFDGILLGSRLMTALEAHTSLPAKEAIVAAPGVDDANWSTSYKFPTGGVITVVSEMGEPIHKLATRGVLFWAEMDAKIFSLDKKKRVAALKSQSTYIKSRLDKDFQKPWFAKKFSGELVDLEEMTYHEILTRLAELLYISSQKAWIDETYKTLFFKIFRRSEERLSTKNCTSLLASVEKLGDPGLYAKIIASRYPAAVNTLIRSQDVQFFLLTCKTRGQKPVPFVPRLDEDFETWMKKDSLWQSENIAAVVDQDAGRICILHGPVSAKYSTKVNEPVKDILDGITAFHMTKILAEKYEGKANMVPAKENRSINHVSLSHTVEADTISNQTADDCITYAITSEILPSDESWFSQLAGNAQSWRQAVFAPDVLWGKKCHPNPFRKIFAPRPNLSVDVLYPNEPHRTTLILRSKDSTIPELARASACNNSSIKLGIFEQSKLSGEILELPLRFSYHPETPFVSVRERLELRNLRIKQFYYALWFVDDYDYTANPSSEFLGEQMVVTEDAVRKFSNVLRIGKASQTSKDDNYAPLDMAMVIAWKVLTKPLFIKALDGDLINLVHLSNTYERIPGATPVRVGDAVSSKSRISEIANTGSGVRVEVTGEISRDGLPVLTVVTQFLYRGTAVDDSVLVREKDEPTMEIHMKTETDVSVLLSKPWVDFHNDFHLLDSKLQFRLRSRTTKGGFKTLTTSGHILANVSGFPEPIVVATVNHEAFGVDGNPIIEYLSRHGTIRDRRILLSSPPPKTVVPISIPASNKQYAQVSGDFNPIHVSPTFAQLASLPGTITHGMYTSAVARNLVQSLEGGNTPSHFQKFTCSFLGMVLPRDSLKLEMQHIGMIQGRKIFSVVVSKAETGEVVLQGEAEIDQPKTAYLFTGQGSQEQGMGMELYEKSPVARALWDQTDVYLMERFGFSILHIVRENPKSYTVKFGGPRGRQIHQNYLNLRIRSVKPDGTVVDEPILEELTPESTSYTFRSSSGLIFATQFAQLAIVILEKAAFEDMRAHGLVPENCQFAGHSLGEYGAMAAMGDIMPIEQLLFAVFYRGLTMQTTVERDAQGRTEYSLFAVNPSRLSSGFDEDSLKIVVTRIAAECGLLLEIVNLNISNQQYVCAGHLVALHTLGTVLDELSTKSISFKSLSSETHPNYASTSATLDGLVNRAHNRALQQATPIVLSRGIATIPLHGVDVPFHSSHLRNGIEHFRAMLLDQVKEDHLDPYKLIGRYIPNLTAKPFSISKEHFEETYALTQSPRLKDILDSWDNICIST